MSPASRRLARLAAGALALALGTFGVLRAQEAREITSKLAEIREAAADRDLPRVERLVAEFGDVSPGADSLDEARLLLGRTRMLSNRVAEAAEAVASVVDRTESPWHVKALYLTAESAARRRQWNQAADIYAQRVEWAASETHAAELASLHREIADGAFEGDLVRDEFGREKRVPDWATARRFYVRARELHVPVKDRALVSYRIGKAALESGDAAGAVTEWRALLDATPGEWADDALYGLGQAYLRLGRPTDALAAFRRVREEWADGKFAPLALIGIGDAWTHAGATTDEDLRRTVEAWREFVRLYPSHAEAPAVALRTAELLFQRGRLREAIDADRAFLEKFPQHEQAPAAQDRIARAHLQLGEFDKAIAEWQVLLGRWPNHALWAQAQRNVAAASFAKGRAAFDEKKYADARTALEAFLVAFPVDPQAPVAQRLLGEIHAQERRHAEAVEAWRLVASKYPESPEAPAAQLRIAATYEGPLADLDRALEAYEEIVKRWPGSPQAGEARTVLAQMKGKNLEVRVERPFRTDESPAASMRVRNVRRLRMKAYRVRPDEYLQRKGGLAGVEQVEVDIVKPDHAWDWDVPEFARYRLLERACPLPLTKPGAYIVTAAEEELTATFMVLVSDLTTIVKSSPGQALVFVWDERAGTPVAGAEVRLLDGDARGVTGADGVWKRDDTGVSRVRALVQGAGPHAGHFAFADGTSGGSTAFGYTTKVHLATDRPIYRPGQKVFLRGIVRRVSGGAYVTEKALDVVVRITDPRGATLLDRKLPTDEFGVIAGELELASEPSLGTYTLAAELDGRTFTQTFDVMAYRKPDVLVSVTPAGRAYLVGDEVKATVSLRYAVGGAVAGANVRWSVFRGPFTFDPSVHEAFSWFFRDAQRDEELRRRAEAGAELYTRGEGVTDVQGKLEIAFATTTDEQDRTYTLVVEAQDPNRRWVQSSAGVPVTRQALYAVSRTEKKVYRPGESIRLEVTTVDPLHTPLAVEGRAVLVRRTLVDQHWVEDETASVPTKTDAAGRAVVELRAEKPGEYLAKFVAKDARGTEIQGATPLTISGDAEDLAKQARLVADREFYREGDVAKVFVNVPVAPAPVLITYEGNRVLEHRVFVAKERSNTIELALRAEHAPNVFLRMAVAKGGKLFEDGDEVAVFQYLDVAVTAEPADLHPGGKTTIRVKTTDQSGRPVRAQVGVDVVDSAILQLAADTTPQVKPFFYDQRRTHAVATASSAGAPLPSVTRPTNKDLLFEQMRRLGKQEWERMQEHVRLGREALDRGEGERAREELSKALEIAPGNYEARVLLQRLDDQRQAAAEPPAASKAPKPGAPRPSEPAKEKSRDRATADAAEADAPFEGGAENGTIGIGGGAGGAFGGRRGGRRNLRAGGGGKKDDKAQEDADLAMDLAETIITEDANELRQDAWGLKALHDDLFAEQILLAQAAAPLVPAELRQRFEDTAASSPGVRTVADGTGTLEVDLPDNLTEWRVTARGASVGPLVGEGRTSFRTSKSLLVRADAPRFLTEGDVTSATGTVHSSLDTETDVTVRFLPDGLRADGPTEAQARIAPGGVRPFEVHLTAGDALMAKLRVEALTTTESDAAVEALPVVAWGLPYVEGASGLLTEEAFAELKLPASPAPGTLSLTVMLSPSIDIALLESLAYTGSYPWGCVEQTVNRFLPAVVASAALDAAGSHNERLKQQVDESVRRGLAALYALQNDDGSFGWFGARRRGVDERAAGGDPEMTAYAVLGFVRAESAGFAVSTSNRDRAIAAAKQLVRGAVPETRAFLLYALSFAKQADLADLNALHRERATLSSRALALLALSMQRTGRSANAIEAVRLLEGKALRANGAASWDTGTDAAKSPLVERPVVDAEATGYALLAFLATDDGNPLVDEAAAWLVSARRGPAWRSTRDTAAAIEALAEHARSRGVERAQCEVDVYVNDATEPVTTARFGGPGTKPVDAPVSVSVPAGALKPGAANKIVLRKRGQGRVHWSALAACVARPAEGQRIEAGGRMLEVARDYTAWVRPPLPGETPAQHVVPGWSVVVPEKRPPGWHGRPLAVAGTSDKVRVTLRVSPRVALQRVIVEDPLPAGFEVVSGSAEGAFDREERRDDRQVFFLSSLPRATTLSYVIQAIHPGDYRARPATARPMYEPEIHGWSAESRMTVRPEPGLAGRPPSSEEITPDEVYAFALRAFDRSDWTAARSGLDGLLRGFELRPEIAEEVLARLFVIGIEIDDAELAVRSYEQLVDRNPRRAPTDLRQRRLLARAHQKMGEHERALTLYRDLGHDLFALDREAAQAFASIGNPWRARDLLLAALRRQPDVAWVEAEEFAAARATAQMRAPVRHRDGVAPTRVPATNDAQPLLLEEAVKLLRAFQAHHADSALAHEAGHATVQALLQMGLAAEAISEGTRFQTRHPGSKHLDDVTYLVAEGHFQAAAYDQALAAAKPLMEKEFPRDDDPSKRGPSPFRAQAIHLAAKVAHLRGDLARAVDLYRQVEDLFPDARDAREFLTREGLTLREVETAAVGETPRLHLRRKNLPEVRLKVYAVDFMILYALRRNLSEVNRIDLSGIEPVKEWVVARRGAEDFGWHEEEIDLPAKEKGVYLVVARGGALDASSVVLVSDLEVQVQETGGRLRVYATDRKTGAPSGEVYVKVGDGTTIRAQGFTDARGVFETASPGGSFSVVAEKDGNVALWRR